MSNIIYWVKNNKKETALLVLILFLSVFLRLYKIDQYMTFLGDEGRDVIIVRKLLVNFDLIFVGPGTSIGNMYLGPLYYYMMAPALLLTNFNPVGPSIMVALLGVATVFFVFFVTKEWFGTTGAYIAAIFYAISPVVIIFSRHSWNPNIMPFFALLTIYSIWKVWQEHRWKWLWILGIAFAFVLQSHYLGLILLPIIIIIWFLTFRDLYLGKITNRKLEIGKYLKNSLILLLFFIGLMSPLIMFDAKHNWVNIKAIQTFFLERKGLVSFSPLLSIERIYPTWQLIMTRLVSGTDIQIGKIIAFVTLIFIGYIVFRLFKNGFSQSTKKAHLLLFLWLAIGLVGLSFYHQEIYDHYLGFLFPAPFILFGAIGEYVVHHKKLVGDIFVLLVLIILVYVNLSNSPLKVAPGRQLQNTIEIARKVQQESEGKRFNFAVIADRNYEGAYQYFLELWGTHILMIDPQRYDDTLADQLFVVCEYEDKTKCQPTSNPKAGIANFGWSKIDEKWNVDGVVLFRLVPNK